MDVAEHTNREKEKERERDRCGESFGGAKRAIERVRAKGACRGRREGEAGVVRAKGSVFSSLGKRRQRRKGEVQGKGGESRSESSRSSTSPTLHNTVRLPSTASIDWTPYCLR